MAIDWNSVESAMDLANRAFAVKKQIEDLDRIGFAYINGNLDLGVAFTGQLRNFCLNQQQSLFDQARAALQRA